MKPNIKEKLKEMAGPKGIDLSVIMGGAVIPNPMEMKSEMPEVSAESVYEMISDKFVALDSDEILKVIHMILMNRVSEEEED